MRTSSVANAADCPFDGPVDGYWQGPFWDSVVGDADSQSKAEYIAESEFADWRRDNPNCWILKTRVTFYTDYTQDWWECLIEFQYKEYFED